MTSFFNVSLIYQDGTDYVPTSSEEENVQKNTQNKTQSPIATLTLGVDSKVKLSHRGKPHKQDLFITSGSLYVLEGNNPIAFMSCSLLFTFRLA